MTSAAEGPLEGPVRPGKTAGQLVDWQRNLAALWVAEFVAILGFSFVFPFLPLFIRVELHIPDLRQVSLWAGVAGGAAGFGLAAASPIWGMLADRYGRKPMLLRAMLAGALLVSAMGFSRSVYDLTVLRFLQGAFTGTIATATALVAAETPRHRVGWALGVLTSAVAIGGAIGPTLGGFATSLLGLRHIFIAGGILLLLSTIPVIALVRESGRDAARNTPPPEAGEERGAGPGRLHAILAIIVAQGLVQFGFTAAQQLVAVRLLHLLPPADVPRVTGVALGIAGLGTGLAAVTYSAVARRIGYRWTVIAAGAALAGTIVIMAVASLTTIVVTAIAVFGLLYGVLTPATSSMLGLESPRETQARIFGFSTSAISLGLAIGPLTCGAVAAVTSPTGGMFVAAVSAAAMAVVMVLASREPVR